MSSSNKEASEREIKNSSSSLSVLEIFSSISQKKTPPIKAPVGLVPPPQIKDAKSKVGSLDNIKHKPGGGDKKVFDENVKYEYTHLKNDTRDNFEQRSMSKLLTGSFSSNKNSSVSLKKTPTRSIKDQKYPDVKTTEYDGSWNDENSVVSVKKPPTMMKKVKSKVGSLDNIKHKPGGGNKKIFDEKDISQTRLSEYDSGSDSDYGLKDSISSHSLVCPVQSQLRESFNLKSPNELLNKKSSTTEVKKIPPIKAEVGKAPPADIKRSVSKIGSLHNIKHKPKGGDKKIENNEVKWSSSSKVGSLENISHRPSGGEKKIFSEKLNFERAGSKIGSKENLKHSPGGGTKKIPSEKLDFKERAQSKVGSLDNIKHSPGGGNVKIIDEKHYYSKKTDKKRESE